MLAGGPVAGSFPLSARAVLESETCPTQADSLYARV